jgi:hypothetical protein
MHLSSEDTEYEETSVYTPELDYGPMDEQGRMIKEIPYNDTNTSSLPWTQQSLLRTTSSSLIRRTSTMMSQTVSSTLFPKSLAISPSLSTMNLDGSLTQRISSTLHSFADTDCKISTTWMSDALQQFWKERMQEVLERPADPRNLGIPLSRVKRVMKMDESVLSRIISTDVRCERGKSRDPYTDPPMCSIIISFAIGNCHLVQSY